jgi:hypothetical protein
MMNTVLKFAGLALLVLLVVLDSWLLSFRCPASPNIHWSRLGFGILIQVLAIGSPALYLRIFGANERKANVLAVAVSLFLAVASFPMVRDSLLFGDSVDPERTNNSKGFLCPDASNVFIGRAGRS